MKIKSSIQLPFLFFICFLMATSAVYSMEFMTEAVGEGAFAGVEGAERTALEGAVNEAVENALGKGVTLEGLPEEVTKGFQKDLTEFVEKNQELLKTSKGIQKFGQELQTQLGESFEAKFKPEVEKLGKFTPDQIEKLAKFNKIEATEIEALKKAQIPEGLAPGVGASGLPESPNQALEDGHEDALNNIKAAGEDLSGATQPEEVADIGKQLKDGFTNLDNANKNLTTAENTQLQNVEKVAEQADAAVQPAQDGVQAAQQTGDKAQVENAKEKVSDAQLRAKEARELADQQTVKSSKAQFERASRELEEANAVLDKATKELNDLQAGKIEGMVKGTPEYTEYEKALTDLKETTQERVEVAKEAVVETRERYEKIVSAEGSIREQLTLKAKNAARFLAEQTLMSLIFMVPGWAAQSIIEARQKKALLDTLHKNQQFGKIYMTLPRCFINTDNPAASFYMYVGVEEQNKNNSFNGDEAYLSKPANYYVAAPSFGEWASVAITDPTFPNVMAHLDTGFIFDGDGSPADVQCPAAQLIGQVPQYSECKIVLQEEKLNHLSGPANASAVATLYASQTPWEAEESSGYKGSPTIAGLLDSSKNTDWQIFYPAVKTNNETSLMYGAILNPAMGSFRSKTKAGNFQLQEIQGLEKDLGKLEAGAEGDEKKPYVAQGLWIYQTQDTPQLKTVINQLQAKGEADLIPFVWDYIIALDNEGKVIQLQEVYPGDNGFQHYTFNASQTKVKFLCSLLQSGLIGGQQIAFEIYELDGDVWKSSSDFGFSNPLADKNSDFNKLFTDDNRLQKQIGAMYTFVEGRVVSGPFLIGSKQLEISDDLLAANMPIYKVANSLADGSDDYVVAVSWPPNILKLPDASAKYLWSLVTSRVYQPSNFAPNTEQWYVKVSGDGSDASPYKVGFSNVPKDGFPYKAPLYSVIMPQGVNPNIITYNNQQISLPAPDLYATKILPITVGGTTKPIGQVLSANDAPDAFKKVWQAINNSFTSWKGFLHALEEEQKNNVDDSMTPKAWVKDRFPPIILQATNEADIVNGFYVYKTDEYAGEFLVMSTSQELSDAQLGKEFDTTNPQQYVISLSTGNIYDGKNEGKLASVPPLDPTAVWQQVQKNNNWPGKLSTWQQRLTTLQSEVKTATGDDLTKEQNELSMLQQLLAQVTDNANNKISQAQANFNNLNDAIISSQKSFGFQAAAKQYGNNLFGPFSFFINKKDLQNRAYFYQDVTTIANPMSNLDANGDVKGVTDYFVCGQAQKDGSITWGYQLDGNTDRVLDLITGAVFSRGGFQGTYTKFSQAYTNASGKNSQILIDDYLNTVLAAIKAQFGVSPRPEMQAAIQKLLEPQFNLLEKEKQQVIALEEQEKARNAPMDPNLMANLKSAKYLTSYSTLSQQSLKNYAGKYYLVPQDDSGNIVSYTDYNVGSTGKDNNVGATYDAQGNILVRVSDWPLQNMRAKVGVVVDAKGQQSLAIGVDQPMIPLQNLVKLASIPSTGTPTTQEAALKQQVTAAQTALTTAIAQATKTPQNVKAQQQVLQASSDLAVKNLMYNSARMLNVAIQNNYITVAKGWTYEYYYDTQTGSYFGKIIAGDKAYYLDLSSGFTYEINGVPRVRKDVVYFDTATNLEAITWFDGDTKHRMLMAILPTSMAGKQFAVYRTTSQIPPSTYTPQEGQAMVTYQDQPAIQQQCTNINDPDDDKMVVTNDYVRGTNKNVAFMDVWDVVQTDAGENLTEIGAFKPIGTQYFAHLAYVQTRSSGQASGAFDPQNVQPADDIPTVMIWDGGSDLKLQELYYQYQFIPLTASGANAFTGAYIDTSGKSHPITVTKEQKTLTTGTGPTIIAMWISIKDGNKLLDYHYDTSSIEQDSMNQLKQLWGINVVTDAFGQSRLIAKFDSLKRNITVANVPKNQQTIINQILPNIGFDAAASRYLYKLTTAQATAYGLESYEPTMNNWYVDMANGVLFDLNDYPSGRALQASDMSKLMDNLQIGVTFDANGIPSGLHYRTATDISVPTTPTKAPAPKTAPKPAAKMRRK